MSLLNLINLDEDVADHVIAAVRQWCVVKGYKLDSAKGHDALETAVRLVKAQPDRDDLFAALLQQMSGVGAYIPTRQVLVVEDEPLIAMDLENTLDQAGYATILCLTRLAAKEWLVSHTPAAAILDLKLKDGTSEDLATLLVSKDVPLIVCSGAEQTDAPEVFARATWLPKPCHYPKLLATLEDAMLQAEFARAMAQHS